MIRREDGRPWFIHGVGVDVTELKQAEGNLQVRLDSDRDVQFNIREHPHVDYGYAVTSHSSQGATADRVLVHVDTEQAHDQLVNSRLAYVSVSRGGDNRVPDGDRKLPSSATHDT